MSEKSGPEYRVHHEQMFGTAIREFRHEAGVRQAELADSLEVHRTYLSAIENGKTGPTMRTVMRAVRELGLEVIIRPVRR